MPDIIGSSTKTTHIGIGTPNKLAPAYTYIIILYNRVERGQGGGVTRDKCLST